MKLEDKIKKIEVSNDKNMDRYFLMYEKYCDLRKKGLTKQKNFKKNVVISNLR